MAGRPPRFPNAGERAPSPNPRAAVSEVAVTFQDCAAGRDRDRAGAPTAGPSPSLSAVRSVASVLHLLVKANHDVLQYHHVQTFPLFASDWRHQHLSVATYLYRLEQFAACSPEVFVVALFLLKRLQEHRAMPPITQTTFHRCYLTCLVLAIKFYEDNTLTHADLATVGCVTPAELTAMEVDAFAKLSFTAFVSHKAYALVDEELDLFANLSRSQYEKVGLEGALGNPDWGLSVSDVLRESVMLSQSVLRASKMATAPVRRRNVARAGTNSSGEDNAEGNADGNADKDKGKGRRRSDNSSGISAGVASLMGGLSGGDDDNNNHNNNSKHARARSHGASAQDLPFIARPLLASPKRPKSVSLWRRGSRSPSPSAPARAISHNSNSATLRRGGDGGGGGGRAAKSVGAATAFVPRRMRPPQQRQRSFSNGHVDAMRALGDAPLSPSVLEARRSSSSHPPRPIAPEMRLAVPGCEGEAARGRRRHSGGDGGGGGGGSRRLSLKWRGKKDMPKKAHSASARPTAVVLMRLDSL